MPSSVMLLVVAAATASSFSASTQEECSAEGLCMAEEHALLQSHVNLQVPQAKADPRKPKVLQEDDERSLDAEVLQARLRRRMRDAMHDTMQRANPESYYQSV